MQGKELVWEAVWSDAGIDFFGTEKILISNWAQKYLRS